MMKCWYQAFVSVASITAISFSFQIPRDNASNGVLEFARGTNGANRADS